MLNVKWKVALYLDERANDDQRNALTQIFAGKAGGLMEQLAGFIGEVAGVSSVPMEYTAKGRSRSVRIGNVATATIEAIDGAAGGDTLIHNPPLTLAPGEPLVVARSKQLKYADHGMQFEINNKNGYYAPFAYSPA
jgi:hypothetical protein